eukprot:Colp12_sorted_trinity150504_noHs@25645
MPTFPDMETITVSPFYFHRADIKPSVFVPMYWALYPPSEAEFEKLFRLGYIDAVEWMDKKGYRPPEGFQLPMWARTKPMLHSLVSGTRRQISSDSDESDEQIQIKPKESSPERRRKSALRTLKRRKPDHVQDGRTVISDFLDILVFVLVVLILKPVAFVLLYSELIVLTTIAMVKALLHDVLPTFSDRTREKAWQSLGLYLRSLLSPRNVARAFFGKRVPINEERLFQQSLVYRVLYFHI